MKISFMTLPLWMAEGAPAAPAASVAPAADSAPAPQAAAPAPKPAAPPVPDPTAAPAGTADGAPKGAEAKAAPSLLGGEAKPAEAAPAVLDVKALKAPEGFKLDEKDLGAFGEIATKAKLGTEAAQELLNLHANVVKTAQSALADHWRQTNEDWVKAVKADPDIGGSRFEGVRANISKVMDQYGDRGLRDALDLTGAGNHPAVIKFLAKVSAALTEGKHVTGGPPASAKGARSPAQIMYPNMKGES